MVITILNCCGLHSSKDRTGHGFCKSKRACWILTIAKGCRTFTPLGFSGKSTDTSATILVTDMATAVAQHRPGHPRSLPDYKALPPVSEPPSGIFIPIKPSSAILARLLRFISCSRPAPFSHQSDSEKSIPFLYKKSTHNQQD